MMALPPEQQAHIAALEVQAQQLQLSRQALAAGDPFLASALLQPQQHDAGAWEEAAATALDAPGCQEGCQPQQGPADGSEELLQIIQLVNQQGLEGERRQQHQHHQQPSDNCCDEEEAAYEQGGWEEDGQQGHQEHDDADEMAVALGAFDEGRYRSYSQQVSARSPCNPLQLAAFSALLACP